MYYIITNGKYWVIENPIRPGEYMESTKSSNAKQFTFKQAKNLLNARSKKLGWIRNGYSMVGEDGNKPTVSPKAKGNGGVFLNENDIVVDLNLLDQIEDECTKFLSLAAWDESELSNMLESLSTYLSKLDSEESDIKHALVIYTYKHPNIRFLKDHISLDAQQYFGIRYDVESQGIVIPIRNEYGQLIGVKERFNYEISDGALKYFYSYPGRCSTTLFGYTQNYQYLVENTVFVGEAEKFVMQCYSYGYRNAVALMSGSLSVQQARLLVELHPTKVIFLHDQGYELDNIKRNVEVLHHYSKFAEFEIGYWDWTKSYYAPKVSATDMGKEKFEYIINNEILILGDDKDEEEL